MLPKYYEFLNSVKIMSGEKALENIPHELDMLGAKKPIILTDAILAKTGALDKLTKVFDGWKMDVSEVFTDIPPDSSIKTINHIAEIFKEKKCDAILALGGGSVIDTAKGLRIVIEQGGDDVMAYMGLESLPRKKRVPFAVVPTTSGTGSECTNVAVIANPDKNVKMEFISYDLLPDFTVIDPAMTETMPPKITANTGVDALVHAVEAYTCLQKNPMSQAYAFAAMRLIVNYLPKAVAEGSNKEYRLAMGNAATMAGIAFSNSMVGIVHAIGHALGGVAHVPHGIAMSILLPHCMRFNLETLKSAYGELLLPLAGAEAYASTPKEERAEKAIEFATDFIKQFETVGLPTTLSAARVTEDQFEAIAKTAVNDGAIIVNPFMATKEQVIEILKAAF
ncbi:MAG: iron-containing alcohol dehydrogenase [Clostridia bacterium]|nr:iron-containing alcohol dehydrogenase [Clostridia bacterium]